MTPDTPTPAEPIDPKLPRRLLDVACRIRAGETLFRDDELVDAAAHALKALLATPAEIAQPATPEPAEHKPDMMDKAIACVGAALDAAQASSTVMHWFGFIYAAALNDWRATQPATHVALTDEQCDRLTAAAMLTVADPLIWGRLGPGNGDMLRQLGRSIVRAALATQVAFSSSNTSNTLGDAADAAGLFAPALRASASIPIAKDTSQAVRVLRLALQAAREFIVSEAENQYGPASQVDREQAISEVTHVLRITEP